MKLSHIQLSFLVLIFLFSACSNKNNISNQEEIPTSVFKIAFGSCAHEEKDQTILDSVLTHQPDLFIYLGDNIYGDSRDMAVLQAKYNRLASKPEFQRLSKGPRILATWDDHDYGENDAGKYYPFKEASKELFLNFWKEPQDSERRQHPGIYHAEQFKIGKKTLQVILLDTRTFRTNLMHVKDTARYKNDYQPIPSPDSTMLGDEQWLWLKKQFKQKADIRIVASSNQFSHEYNGWESWNNIPHERQKMLDLIDETQANGIVFLSGDVHWGELSKEPAKGKRYPIYDVTSSGLTQTWETTEPNKNRVGEVIRQNNFGLIEIECAATWKMRLNIIDKGNNVRVTELLHQKDLMFRK